MARRTRKRRRQQAYKQNIREILSNLTDVEVITYENNHLVIRVKNLGKTWSKLEELCGPLTVIEYSRPGLITEINVCCPKYGLFIKLIAENISSYSLVSLDPIFLLYEKPRVNEFDIVY